MKGVSLGISKMKAIEIYGKPDKEKNDSDFEILKWQFFGDAVLSKSNVNSTKPFAKNSFGHSVTMFFSNGLLVAQILYNDIP